jgi:hypothetical protein
MKQINVRQFETDIILAQRIFGRANVQWSPRYDWIKINNYRLPPIYNQRTTNCLIMMPNGYGYGSPLEEFYLNKGLQVRNGRRWTDLPHYFSSNIHKGISYESKNWHWLCIKSLQWSRGDNLLTFLKQVELFLKEPFEDSLS